MWEKIRDRKAGNNLSIVYKNNNRTLEIFKDATWGNVRDTNVIIRDTTYPSLADTRGKTIDVKHCGTKKEAMDYAKRYMNYHQQC